jgi:hypothetical protein
MKKSIILEIYACIVCFSCIIAMSIYLYSILISSLSYYIPEYMDAAKLQTLGTNEECRYLYEREEKEQCKKMLNEISIEEKRSLEIIKIKNLGLEGIIKSSLGIFILTLLFLAHWKILVRIYKELCCTNS